MKRDGLAGLKGTKRSLVGLVSLLIVVTAFMRYAVPTVDFLLTLALCLVPALAAILLSLHAHELASVLVARSPSRSAVPVTILQHRQARFVSLHVPICNEPADVVLATLAALLRQDYPAFEILVVDNNTRDPLSVEPIRTFCGETGVRFYQLGFWPGYKAGALNFALSVTDPRAEVVAIVDSDYIADPTFLSDCTPLFDDPKVAFLQTPQDYRLWSGDPYSRALYQNYRYFFRVSQAARARYNAAIFGGTMGLIRRGALEEVGGWGEWCITEDVELSFRLLKRGYSGVALSKSYGWGLMPPDFSSLKRQRYRWCFGGIQLLRRHWRSLMPWDRSPENRLTLRQRYHYLSGAAQWFGDLFRLGAVPIALACSAVAGALGIEPSISVELVSACIAAIVIGMDVVRAVAIRYLSPACSFVDSAGATCIWFALGRSVALAAITAAVGRESTFTPTPKALLHRRTGWRESAVASRAELLLAFVISLSAAVYTFVCGLGATALVASWQVVGLLCTPVMAYAGQLDERAPFTGRGQIGLVASVRPCPLLPPNVEGTFVGSSCHMEM